MYLEQLPLQVINGATFIMAETIQAEMTQNPPVHFPTSITTHIQIRTRMHTHGQRQKTPQTSRVIRSGACSHLSITRSRPP